MMSLQHSVVQAIPAHSHTHYTLTSVCASSKLANIAWALNHLLTTRASLPASSLNLAMALERLSEAGPATRLARAAYFSVMQEASLNCWKARSGPVWGIEKGPRKMKRWGFGKGVRRKDKGEEEEEARMKRIK